MATRNNEIRNHCKQLYLEGKEAAEIVILVKGVSKSLLYTWIKKYGWAQLRDKKLQSYQNASEILLSKLEEVMQALNSKDENGKSVFSEPGQIVKIADSVAKIVKSIKSLDKDKDRLAQVLFVTGELGMYMNELEHRYTFDDDFRQKFDKLLEGFQARMIEKYSPLKMQN